MPMTDTCAVVIFARHPTPGRVKTRLARDTGDEAAAAFYKACAEHVIGQALSCPGCTCYLFFSLAEEEGQVKAWLTPLGQGLVLRPQLQSPVLGDRMYAAMASCLAEGHPKVMIIGTDVPDLTCQIMDCAIAELDRYQLVFGPAEDGGYYLMGATAMPPGIFEGITWSTDSVLESNLGNAARLGLGVAPLGTLPTLADIDTLGDLERWLGGAGASSRSGGGGGKHNCGGSSANTAEQRQPVPAALREAAEAALVASREKRRQEEGS